MSPKDAIYATRQFLKPKFAIPIHYGTNRTSRKHRTNTSRRWNGQREGFPMNPGVLRRVVGAPIAIPLLARVRRARANGARPYWPRSLGCPLGHCGTRPQ